MSPEHKISLGAHENTASAYSHWAELARSDSLSELREEIETSPFVNGNDDLLRILNTVIEIGDKILVEALIQCGTPVTDPDGITGGFPPLAVAVNCERRDSSIVELLLMKGAEPNEHVMQGTTPLLIAVQNCDIPISELLLTFRADVQLEDVDTGFTPLMLAASLCHTQAVELLLKYGANPDHRSSTGLTAYDVAGDTCRRVLGKLRLE